MRFALALVLLLGACTEPRSETCRSVCAREVECYDEAAPDENFDEGECLDACATLERDSQTVDIVERHAVCVREADTCTAVVACQQTR